MSFPPLPTGIYRIRSTKKVDPPLYATLGTVNGSTGLVAAPLNKSDKQQLWKVRKYERDNPDFRRLENAATSDLVYPKEPSDGERDFRVLLAGQTGNYSALKAKWSVNPVEKDNICSLTVLDASYDTREAIGYAVDLSDFENRIIMWSPNGLANQLWALEEYTDVPNVVDGQYRIRSKKFPDLYLKLEDDMKIGPATLDTSSQSQIWNMKMNADTTWSITSNANGKYVAPAVYRGTEYTIRGSDDPASWIICPNLDGTSTIRPNCLDDPRDGWLLHCFDPTWVIIWHTLSGYSEQFWFVEKVE